MNVICILLDTLRRDHLGCYGNEQIHTPNLDRLARNGARFEQSYLGSYPCMPARQDLFTGRLNFLWRGWSPLEYDEQNLPELLREHSKTSMLITDHYHLWQYGAGNYHFAFSGTEFVRGQERDNWITNPDADIRYPAAPEKLNKDWESYARNTANFKQEEQYFAAQVFQKSMDWVEENQNQKDFFLMIDCFDPHEPFDPPPGYIDRYNPNYQGESAIWPKTGNADSFSPDELKQIHALYCAEITFVDHWFGKFYDKLEHLGLLEDTMIIVTSDHGFLFGEHNWLGKHARLLFQDIARTPLLIQSPEVEEGSSFNTLVQMHDLTPTILRALNVPIPETMQGQCLQPLWDASTTSINTGAGTILNRKDIVFGVFGGPVYGTDGEWLIVKKPTSENSPLYWYTKSHFEHWDFGQTPQKQNTLKAASDWNGHRFSVQYANGKTGHAGPRYVPIDELDAHLLETKDELYHIHFDHAQQHDVYDKHPYLREKLLQSMCNTLRRLDVPQEQYVRLGLDKEVHSLE